VREEETWLEELKLAHPVQIEALKEVGVTEVVLAINYRPEVETDHPSFPMLYIV
jgi:hypothetical protein